jgi:hypothetical protein
LERSDVSILSRAIRALLPTGGVADGQKGREWLQVDAPANYQAAIGYMLAHPGMPYESAYDFVSRGH